MKLKSLDAGLTLFIQSILLLFAATLLVHNVNLPSSIMAGDEYLYFEQAREFPNNAKVLTYDPFTAITNNAVYFWIGHFLWEHTVDPALSMRIVQAVVYVLNFPVLYLLCRQFLPRSWSAFAALLCCVSARSSYSAYFMPETIFAFFFFLLVSYSVCTIRFPILSAIGCGWVVALLMLTKPHGLAIGLGVALAWSFCFVFPRFMGIARRKSAAAFATFLLATYLSLICINVLLTGTLKTSPLLFVGDLYLPSLKTSVGSTPPLSNLLTLAVSNFIAIGLLVGFPIAYVLINLFVQLRANDPPASSNSQRQFRFLLVLATAVSAIIVAMTIVHTAHDGVRIGPDQLLRMHGRYYSFALPLFLILMLAVAVRQGRQVSPATLPVRLVAILGILLMPIVQFYWRSSYVIAPYDFPEIFSLAYWAWKPGAMHVATDMALWGTAAFAAIAAWPTRGPILFACYFLLLNLDSLYQTTSWQYAHARAFEPYWQPGTALRKLLPSPLIDQGVIIAPDRGLVSYVLFELRSRSRVALRPAQSVIDTSVVGNAAWVLVVGNYNMQLMNGRIVLQNDKLTLMALPDASGSFPIGSVIKTTR